MDELSCELKIPKDRVAVLIGTKGEIKLNIEKSTNTKIEVDSKEGDIFIAGHDGLDLFTAKEIISAVGRGFNPEVAMMLTKVDCCFEKISLTDFTGKSKDTLMRLKGRVIGKEGKSRKHIEELTETHISVYGKTIGIIGQTEAVKNAARAIGMLIEGSNHSSVYHFLEKKRRQQKRGEMQEKWQ